MFQQVLGLAACCVLVMISSEAASLQYQARLTDPGSGDPREGSFSMTFRLYETDVDGTAVWTETKDVLVENGLFNTLLGDTTPLPVDIFDGRDLWLGIQVGADEEAVPRQPLVPSAYAMHADDADSLDGKDSTDFAGTTHGHDGTDITGTVTDAAIPDAIARDAEVMPIVKDGDGSGSGVDADLLDGLDSTNFAQSAHGHDGADITGAVNDAVIPDTLTRDAEVIPIVTGGDGSGSGVDADLLDGMDSTDFVSETGPETISSSSTQPTLSVTQSGDGIAGEFQSDTDSALVGSTTADLNYRAGVVGKAGDVPVSIIGKYGVYGESDSGKGVAGVSSTDTGIFGYSVSADAIKGQTPNGSGAAIRGLNTSGTGTAYGVYGSTSSGDGTAVLGNASNASGSTTGVKGESLSSTGIGVLGNATSVTGETIGVKGKTASNSGIAVHGESTNVSGTTYGVLGESESDDQGAGVLGKGNYVGTWGQGGRWGIYGKADPATAADGYSIYGATPVGTGYAGYFSGNVNVTGTLTKSSGAFMIDHPLDPENKYLSHSFVESPDMMNVYNGNIVLDADGAAWVTLPDWFEALNREFRYQLTAVGRPGPNLYVAEEINGNRFRVAGGTPGLKVSWQVTGIRQDPYAEANRIMVEEDKPEEERGTYLHPEAYGVGAEKGLTNMTGPESSE